MSKLLIMYYYIKVMERHGWFVWPMRALLFALVYGAGLAGVVFGVPNEVMTAPGRWLLGAMIGGAASSGGALLYPLVMMITEALVDHVAGYIAGLGREVQQLEQERQALLEDEEAHGGALTIVERDQDDEGSKR